MSGWPRNFAVPGRPNYPAQYQHPAAEPEVPVYAPPAHVFYDQTYYGGSVGQQMAPQNFYPYQNPMPPILNAAPPEYLPPMVAPAAYQPIAPPGGQTLNPLAPSYPQQPAGVPGPAPPSVETPAGAPAVNFAAIPVAEREEEILDFWKRRFILTKPEEEKPFPDKFSLRLVVGLDKRAVEALEVIFKEGNKAGALCFEEDPPSKGNVPNHLKCICRCRWDAKQKWIVGYGGTPAEAKNEAAVVALKTLLTHEEYARIVEINRPERFISLDAQKLASALNQYALSMTHPTASRKRKGSSSENPFPFEYKETTENPEGPVDLDSDFSIGGSGEELTGDEEEPDGVPPEKLRMIKLRKSLYERENRIIKYWLSKRPDPGRRLFPELFRLRNHRNVSKRARSAVMILFQSFPRHQRPVFQSAPNTRPDLGYFHLRCSWDNFKQNIHGYGNTPEAAENDAGVKALIKVMGEEEYAMLDEMTRDEMYDGLDMTRIHAHIAYKNKKTGKPTSVPTTPGFNFESELINYPKTLKRFPPPGTAEVPKPGFKLLSKKLRHYGKLDFPAGFNTVDKIAPFQIFDKLTDIDNLAENAVAALGSLFAGLAEPIPSYIATTNVLCNKVKVECVARGKYFVEEASTEESAKNSAALSALKFLLGQDGVEKLLKAQSPKAKS